MEINREMLLDLFHAPAMSGQEVLTQEYIKSYLDQNKISYEEDDKGNIFHFDGAKPVLIAHMDTVQDIDDVALANFIKIRGKVLSGYGVIGGDDKNGIYIILHLLEEGYDINFAFTVEEEVGGHGSMNLAFFKEQELEQCLYGLILDRRGEGDIICDYNDYGTKNFEDRLCEVGKDYGYSPNRGTFSDADQLNEILSCANLSVGYHNPHSKTEFTFLPQLENAIGFTRSIIENVVEKYEAPDIKYNSRTYNKKHNKSYYNYPYNDDYWDDLWDNDYWGNSIAEKNMCVFCGETKKEDLTYLTSLKEYVCFDCVLRFYEDTYDLATNNFISDKELNSLIASFDESQDKK